MTPARLSPIRFIVLALIAVAALAIPGVASAASGDFVFRDCLTGNTAIGACPRIPAAGSVGANSGLNGAKAVATSADGKSVYVLAPIDDAIARFDRSASTGALAYQGCITGASDGPGATNCTKIPSAAAGGTTSGLDDPVALAVSPDGLSVYVAASSDASIATFNRNTSTGALTYAGCITGSTQVYSGVGGSGACTGIPSASPGAFLSGLYAPSSVAVSPDNASVYLTAANDDSIDTFSRNTGTGALTYQSCLTAQTGVSAAGSCTAIAGVATAGNNSGLDNPVAVVAAPGSFSVYVASMDDDAVAQFDRNFGTGALTYQGCVSGETQSAGCTQIAHAASAGANSGLDQPTSLAVSPDDTSLYLTSQLDGAVARFFINGAGRVFYEDCLSSKTESGPSGTGACSLTPHANSNAVSAEIRGPLGVAVSPDGGQVYASTFYSTLVELNRAGNGSISFGSCITGNSAGGPSGTGACSTVPAAVGGGANSGIGQLEATAVGSDSTSIYAVSSTDDSVARFALQPPAVTPPAPAPRPPAPTPKKKCKKAKKAVASAAKCKKKK